MAPDDTIFSGNRERPSDRERPLPVYRIGCTVCGVKRVAEGLDAAFDFQEDHRREFGTGHVLDMNLIEYTESKPSD